MDLDRASIGVSYMKHITALVLNPSARGLEPRIVRGILERIEQVCSIITGSSALYQLACVLSHIQMYSRRNADMVY